VNRRIFSGHLYLANLLFSFLILVAFVVVVAVITVGFAVTRGVSLSAWDLAMQLPRWFTLFVGVALVKEFMPQFIAHGQTRREFAVQAALFVLAFAPVLALAVTSVFALEGLIYRATGWSQALSREHLYTATDQYPLMFAQFTLEFAVWTVAGALIMAGIYRIEGGGFLSIPLGLALIVPVEIVLNSRIRLPFLANLTGIEVEPALWPAVAVGTGAVLLGFLFTWGFLRDVPLRNRAA
jgi:hypothetical protein